MDITIKNIKQKLISQKGLLLDIDDTLASTKLKWFNLLNNKFGNTESLSPQELINKYRYSFNVPDWQREDIDKFVTKLVHTPQEYIDLEILDNSNHSIEKINNVIPIIGYLTARPLSVRETTIEWLNEHQFPVGEYIFRPAHLELHESSKWKAEVIEYLYPEIDGIIDDSDSILKFLSSDYKGHIFLYDVKKHYNSGLNITTAQNWDQMSKLILEIYK